MRARVGPAPDDRHLPADTDNDVDVYETAKTAVVWADNLIEALNDGG